MNRSVYSEFVSRINKNLPVIHLVTGARQVGKTTMMLEYTKENPNASYYSADDFPQLLPSYIDMVWEKERDLVHSTKTQRVLIIDEIQKVSGWQQSVKKNWEQDKRNGLSLQVVLTGSSRLLLQYNNEETLSGRFLPLYVPHWSFSEMEQVFGFTFEQYVFYGGYPGSVPFIQEEKLWRNYVVNSLIEPAIGQDILMLTPVLKPSLLRRLFDLSSMMSSQVVSFQKLIGQLQDAGNTSTLANYLNLLDQACLVTGLEKYSGGKVAEKNSIPKLQVYNNAFLAAKSGTSFDKARNDAPLWCRLVEASIGSSLVNWTRANEAKLLYWKDGNYEVDYVVIYQDQVFAIEVKSGHQNNTRGLEEFHKQYPNSKCLLISEEDSIGIKASDFIRSIGSYIY